MGKKYITPEGTRDIVLKECKIKRMLQKNIEKILDSWGYDEIITPTIEFYDTINSGFEALREEELYKFFDNKGKIMALRPDMTIPIARVVASKFKEVKEPLKFRYCANVFRVHESLGGKKNEYTDCGVELIGEVEEKSDLEILVTALDVLNVLEKYKYKLEIGNVRFFNSAVEELNLDYDEKTKLSQLIHRKSLKELEEYLDSLNLNERYRKLFLKLPWLFGGKEILEEGKKYCFNKEMKESIEYLKNLSKDLEQLGYGDIVYYDLGMVPTVNYYTGITFRGYVDGVGTTVLSGGRYDKLISKFGEDRPAVGFSINLDSVLDIIKDEEIQEKETYIIFYNETNKVDAFKKSSELRNAGNVVKMHFEKDIKEVKIEKAVK
ncbi:MAG: ATP phosphoribosyltransferase regulatory subunit [Clostridium sp.]|jgi:ATP phosphoribosyltransferase regulatory subunit|nr:ATP phosphoribosyltransferase regulatory subunit [Clostridium sp.]